MPVLRLLSGFRVSASLYDLLPSDHFADFSKEQGSYSITYCRTACHSMPTELKDDGGTYGTIVNFN